MNSHMPNLIELVANRDGSNSTPLPRCTPAETRCWVSASMSSTSDIADRRILRQVVVFRPGYRVVVGPAIHRRQRTMPVAVRNRGRRRPLERVGPPRILRSGRTPQQTPYEI